MSIKRLIHPNPIMNEKSVTYNISHQNSNDVVLLLESVRDGVFGIEAVKCNAREYFNVFAPIHFKINLDEGNQHKLFNSLYHMNTKDVTIAQFYLEKASMFTIGMDSEISIWDIISSIIPNNVNVIYQLLLSYRQDNWKEQLTDQYDCYLNGIENPSHNGLFRKLQVSINEKVDNFLKWEYNHSKIEEVESKINQTGFRYNFRIVLTEGNKKQRELLLKQIKLELNKYSYLNNWLYVTTTVNQDSLRYIVDRKFNSISKNDVLCTSELIPFISHEQKVQNDIKLNEQSTHMNLESNQTTQSHTVTNYKQLENDVFKLLPFGEVLPEVEYTDIANKFIKSLKEVKPFKGDMKVVHAKTGVTVMKITFNIPKQLKFSEINKLSVVSDVQIKMGVKNLQIKQGENVGEIDVILPLEQRRKAFLRNYIDTTEFRSFSENNPLPFLVGVNEIGEPIYGCMNKIKHLLVAGSTGSGKSVWLNSAILTMLMSKSPSDLQMYMIDIKQVELTQFEQFPHVQSVITDAEEAIQLLNQLINEMNRRYELFKNKGVKNIGLYNRNTQNKLPYIVCVIDEYAELTGRNDNVHSYIQSLTQLSRASGIHLIIATQRPSVDVINGTIKSNLPSKIGFRCANNRSYLTFLNTKPKFDLLGSGDGVMDFEGQSSEHVRFQGCLIVDDIHDEGLESKLITKIARMVKEDRAYTELPKIEEVEEESELDKLKRVIINVNETRIAQLQKIMRININKLNDMMQELCKEGFLEKGISRSQGYKLIADEEEIKKWRS